MAKKDAKAKESADEAAAEAAKLEAEIGQMPMPQDVCVVVLKMWDAASNACVQPSEEELAEINTNWGITVLSKASLGNTVDGNDDVDAEDSTAQSATADGHLALLARSLKSDALSRVRALESAAGDGATDSSAAEQSAPSGSVDASDETGAHDAQGINAPAAIYVLSGFADSDHETSASVECTEIDRYIRVRIVL